MHAAVAYAHALVRFCMHGGNHWPAALQDDVTFQQLLAADPDHVVEYLAERGTLLLGTFVTGVWKEMTCSFSASNLPLLGRANVPWT